MRVPFIGRNSGAAHSHEFDVLGDIPILSIGIDAERWVVSCVYIAVEGLRIARFAARHQGVNGCKPTVKGVVISGFGKVQLGFIVALVTRKAFSQTINNTILLIRAPADGYCFAEGHEVPSGDHRSRRGRDTRGEFWISAVM